MQNVRINLINVKASNNYPVHNLSTGLNYTTIQEAIDANETLNGHTIFVEAGTYHENATWLDGLIVDKEISLIGEDPRTTIIDGNESVFEIVEITANNVVIRNFTIQKSLPSAYGVIIMSNNTIIESNIITMTQEAIRDNGDRIITNTTIIGNTIRNVSEGIILFYGRKSRIMNNLVENNTVGMRLEQYSQDNSIINNTIDSNIEGVCLFETDYNNIIGNDIKNNRRGLHLNSATYNNITDNRIQFNHVGIDIMSQYYGSIGNRIYHNDFNNTEQVLYSYGSTANIWDNGYPSGGNYWSDYSGTDFFSGPHQNEAGNDGIGDASYSIDTDNNDEYPLMFPYSAPDISIVRISPGTATVYHSYPMFIGTTVENKGNKTESVHVNVYANATLVGAQNVTVPLHANRTITTMWNTIGFSGEYTISAYAKPLQGEINTSNNRLTDGHVNVMGRGYFIIVAGNRYDNDLLPTINYGCNQVYKILRQVGYTADNIYYLNQPDCGYQDLDGDGKNDIDAWASNANLRWAIESWAASRVSRIQPLYLYLFDHGGSDIFCINNAPEYLYSSQLALWLDNLTRSTGAPIHVIYAACHSGSFVDELSKAGRVIIASSKADEYSYTISGTWEAFSTPFWNQIKSGHSMGSSFNYASSPLSFASWLWRFLYWLFRIHQTPLLDDNGDGVGHAGYLPNGGDGFLANNIYIGACEWPYPWISQVMPSLFSYWPPQSNITLWAKVENNSDLVHVRAYMLPPDWIPPNSTDTLVTLGTECYEMTDLDNDGNWTVNIPIVNFTNHASESAQTANFTFFITAEQDNGDMATPLAVNIRFSKTLDLGIDEIPPYVSIERPLENRIVSNVITVNGTALDDICLKRIEVYVDDNLYGTTSLPNASSSFYEFNLDTTLFENGNRTITVKAFDMADNCCNQTLNVVFMNSVHDTAVTDVEPCKRIVGQGFVSSINVTVANHGSYPEDVNLTVYANETCITSQTLFLSNENYTNMVFNWNTTAFAKGNYNLKIVAQPVSGEIETADNNLTAGVITITVPGDVTGEGSCDMQDISIMIDKFMTSHPEYYANCDVNNDLTIDMADISIAIDHFMQT